MKKYLLIFGFSVSLLSCLLAYANPFGVYVLPKGDSAFKPYGNGFVAQGIVMDIKFDPINTGNLYAAVLNLADSTAGVWVLLASNTDWLQDSLEYDFSLQFDKQGNLYAGSQYGRILERLPSGDNNHQWQLVFSIPASEKIVSLQFDSIGNLYAASDDETGGNVYECDSNTGQCSIIGSNFPSTADSQLNSMIFDSLGNLYVSGTAGIYELPLASNKLVWQVANNNIPNNSAVFGLYKSSDGTLFAGAPGTVYTCAASNCPNWQPMSTTQYPDSNDAAAGLLIDSAGNLYASLVDSSADIGDGIWELSATTNSWQTVTGFPADGFYAKTILSDSNGNIYAGAYENVALNK